MEDGAFSALSNLKDIVVDSSNKKQILIIDLKKKKLILN